MKRRRPDEERDEDLYFEDGNVIISASTPGGDLTYFRVHKSMLSKQSIVFKDMLSMPSPSEVDTYDGLPLVHVHDDVKQLKQFLKGIYDPRKTNCSFLPFLRSYPDTPARVLGPLKLAKKYQADVLQSRIMEHLAGDCPITLVDWDEVAYPDTPPSDKASSESDADPSQYLTRDLFPNPISFINLARECDLPIVFATLLYSLCRESATKSKSLSRMAKEDMEKLILGKDRMMDFISGAGSDQLEIESWMTEDGYCDGIYYCKDEMCHSRIFKVWSALLQDVMSYGDPLATFRMTALKYRNCDDDRYVDYGVTRDEICWCCKDRMANNLEQLRQDLFNQLPSFFNLKEISPQEE